MNTKLLFSQLLIVAVSGQQLDLVGTSPAPNAQDLLASVGLAQPTSPWIQDAAQPDAAQPGASDALGASEELDLDNAVASLGAKETSSDAIAHAAPTGPTLNLLNNAAEGDLHGAVPRKNLVYFGVGRHGFGFGAECEGDCDHYHGEQPCHHERPCNHPQRPAPPPAPAPHGRFPPPPPPPAGPYHEPAVLPYLKVTPSQVVQTFTRTHIETGTSTSLEVSSYLHTRTVTEELYSTKTNIVHPEKTYTHVDKHTIYEYPASTIDASRIRPYATPVYPERHAHVPCK